MKTILIVIMIAICFSCKKQIIIPSPNFSYDLNFTYDGKPWGTTKANLGASFLGPNSSSQLSTINNGICHLDSVYDLIFYNNHPKSTLYIEMFRIISTPLKKGKYIITSYKWKTPKCGVLDTLTSEYESSVESDVASDLFDIATNHNNYLIIENYDPLKKELTGNLDLSYIAPIGPGAPADTIFFKGSFTVRNLK